MSASAPPTEGGPAASSAPKAGLQSGSQPQYKHLRTLKASVTSILEAHNTRLFLAVQSGYSNDILVLMMHNLGSFGPALKELFMGACTEMTGCQPVVNKLRKELAELADPALVVKVVDRLMEIWKAEQLVAPKLANILMNCVVEEDLLDASGEHFR